MDNILLQKKIRQLFAKLIEPGYVMESYYSDGVIEKFANYCSDPELQFLDNIPLLSSLIVSTFDQVDSTHNTVKVFVTRMLAIIAKNELHFTKLICSMGDKINKNLNEINTPAVNASLRVALMEVALACLHHHTGVSWLIKTGIWKEILSLRNEKITVFVVRQKYKFFSEFLWKINDLHDEENIKEIVKFAMNPILERDFLNVKSMTSEEEAKIIPIVEPVLQMLLSVVSVAEKIEKSNLLIDVIHRQLNVPSHLYIVLDRLRREETVLLIANLLFRLSITKTFLQKPITPETVYQKEDFMEIVVVYFNTIQQFIHRRSPTLVLDFCNSCNLIWTNVWKTKTAAQNVKANDDTQSKLQNQLLFICLVPSLVYVKKSRREMCTNERVDEYITKLLNFACEHTARAAYALRDLMQELDMLSVTLQSVKRLTCMKNHLKNEQANLLFQALFYLLMEYQPSENEDETNIDLYEDCQERDQVMTYVLDTELYLVKNHNINWHESLEVICLYTVVYNILKRPNLSCKFIVTAINVITVTVKKFLPPNLSLLMETKPGSTMHELGKLIYKKMHSVDWEVRDSALELLQVCTELSFVKFPPFQKQLLENRLINVAVAVATHDNEFYVQVSALRCVAVAARVPALWELLLSEYPNIQDTMICMLRNNQEGIVRKEVCNVLAEMYVNLKLTPQFKQTLYEHMVSVALADFHWEVQLTALKFWKTVIQTFLNDQGMLDGTFPPVTFSRTTRKIVTLNKTEIQRRLSKTLDELAAVGCLTVLVKSLHEDADIDIMESSLSIASELINTLDSYSVQELLKPNPDDPSSVEDLECLIKENGEVSEDITELQSNVADDVIEGILNSNDMNLLSNIYESHMKLQEKKPPAPVTPKMKLAKQVSPYLFVEFMKGKDFKGLIEQKRKWKEGIKSLSSFLDDVLGIYEVNEEINSMDCY